MSKDLALEQVEWDLHENPEAFIPLEFTQEIKPEIYGLEPKEASQLVGGIDVITAELKALKIAYIDVIELAITSENLPIFKDLRKNFTKNRTSREKLRKAKKSYFLNGGRFVDAIFKNIDAECELMESKLLEAEKYFENLEKQKAKDLNDARIERIRPFVEDVTGLDFAPMNDEDFDDYLLGKKTRFENAKKEVEAEALRTIENHRRGLLVAPYLQFVEDVENIYNIDLEDFEIVFEKCKKAKIDFDKEQEKIKAVAKELQDKKDAEIKAENDRIESAEKLAKAPIKYQIDMWVEDFSLPKCSICNHTTKEIEAKFQSFKNWAKKQSDI